ncbi:hypothetical protein DF186_24260 [Enterococcus hirae]|nr:hypothetical protein DF186_24260 [Enterococcus hirae]
MGVVLLFVMVVDCVICGKIFYCMFLIWFYVVVLVVVGMLWFFMFNFVMGIIVYILCCNGIVWDLLFDGN